MYLDLIVLSLGEINDLKSKTMSKILFGLVGIALISSCTRPGSLYNGDNGLLIVLLQSLLKYRFRRGMPPM